MTEEEEYLTADGLDGALLGLATVWQAGRKTVAVYDADKCIEIIMRETDCDHSEAMEHFEFNIAGSYVGEQTPIFVWKDAHLTD
jgi:hypothetical protein